MSGPRRGGSRGQGRREREPLSFASPARWRLWLRKNHGQESGEWLLIAKKGTARGLRYGEALEEALCWGWIDSQARTHDADRFALWFAPRRRRSIWSAANRAAALRLIAAGRMQEPGLQQVREAKANGRWQAAYASAAPPRLPADARRSLAAAGCLDGFRRLSPSRRLQLVHWVTDAKRPETRARRIAALTHLVRG